jgi:hypothetical protein
MNDGYGEDVGNRSSTNSTAENVFELSKSKSKAVPLHAMEELGGRGDIAPIAYSPPRY